MSAHAARCRLNSVKIYATRPMHMLSMWEFRGGPEDARAICTMLIAPFIKDL